MGGAEGAAPRQGLGLDEAPPGARVATGLARAAICSLYALERRRRDDKAHGDGVDGAMRHVDRAECEDALPRAGGRGTAGGHDANKSSRSFTTGFSATRATCRKACHRHTRHDDEVTADLRAFALAAVLLGEEDHHGGAESAPQRVGEHPGWPRWEPQSALIRRRYASYRRDRLRHSRP